MGIRSGGGVITRAVRDQAGFLQLHATFLMEGLLVYQRGGKKIEELVPWEYISDEAALATATGKPITLGHPEVKDSWMLAKDWKKFAKGMTGNLLYLHRPFAVISCLIGDQKLADDIESGHVQRVSSCRKTKMLVDPRNGQRYQGAWEANHLAFIDKRSGRTGRCPGAMALPKGELPTIRDDGSICLDSVPGVGYGIPDYEKFIGKQTESGMMLFLPPEEEVNEQAVAAKSRRIILDSTYLVEKEDVLRMDDLTPEQIAAIGAAAGTGISATLKESFAAFQDTLVTALTPKEAVADEAPTFTAEDVEKTRVSALAEGRRTGQLLALATQYSVDSVTPESTVTEICTAILKVVAPEFKVDSSDESELPGIVKGFCANLSGSKKAEEKPKAGFAGKKVPVADEDDDEAKDKKVKATAGMKAQQAALQKNFARR
jgi:hypothetical protein